MSIKDFKTPDEIIISLSPAPLIALDPSTDQPGGIIPPRRKRDYLPRRMYRADDDGGGGGDPGGIPSPVITPYNLVRDLRSDAAVRFITLPGAPVVNGKRGIQIIDVRIVSPTGRLPNLRRIVQTWTNINGTAGFYEVLLERGVNLDRAEYPVLQRGLNYNRNTVQLAVSDAFSSGVFSAPTIANLEFPVSWQPNTVNNAPGEPPMPLLYNYPADSSSFVFVGGNPGIDIYFVPNP